MHVSQFADFIQHIHRESSLFKILQTSPLDISLPPSLTRIKMRQLFKQTFQITSHQKHDSGHVPDLHPQGMYRQGFDVLRRPLPLLAASSPSLLLPYWKPSRLLALRFHNQFPKTNRIPTRCQKVQETLLVSLELLSVRPTRRYKENKVRRWTKSPDLERPVLRIQHSTKACCPK